MESQAIPNRYAGQDVAPMRLDTRLAGFPCPGRVEKKSDAI